jgi:hypothetical protein
MPESRKTTGRPSIYPCLKRPSKADFAEAALFFNDFSPAVASRNAGFRENQSQKFALSESEGFSACDSAQPSIR